MEIELTFRRKDFEEFYFIDNRGSYFRDKSIKTVFRNLIIAIAAIISLYIYSYLYDSYDLFQVSLIVLVTFLIIYIDRAFAIRGWRKKIKIYLDSQKKFRNNKLIAADSYFSIVQDEQESIEKWSNVDKAKISDIGIWLIGKESYLIPAKSMSLGEYE